MHTSAAELVSYHDEHLSNGDYHLGEPGLHGDRAILPGWKIDVDEPKSFTIQRRTTKTSSKQVRGCYNSTPPSSNKASNATS
jgi:hypothetical protein